MRKLISMILALLMLALPVLSAAEIAGVGTSEIKELMKENYTAKYIMEGQEFTADVTVEPTELLFAMTGMPEEQATVFKELMAAIGFRYTAQATDSMAQSGVTLLLGGNEAVTVKGAYADKNLYAASNLLGDKVIQITGPQLKEQMKKLLDQAVAEGKISQETVDSVKNFVKLLREDPEAAIRKLIGEPDFQPLMTAVYGLLGGISMGEVTEAPEAFPEAKQLITVKLQKETLLPVATETGRLVWNLPVVQKLISIAKRGPQSEDEMIALFSRVPNAMAEDGELNIYVDETGMALYITADLKLNVKGETRAIQYDQLVRASENGAHMEVNMTAGEAKVNGVMEIAIQDDRVSMDYHITSEAAENGVTYQPMEEIIKMEMVKGEASTDLNMDVTMRVKNDPESQQIGITYQLVKNAADLGDHAEQNGAFTLGMEGIGNLLSVKVAGKTGPAEAYIVTPDAVQPLAMSEEELGELQNEVMQNAQSVLLSSLQYLPPSILQMFGN